MTGKTEQNGSHKSDVLDEYKAAKYLGVCDKTLRKWRKAGKVPYARIGGRVLYLRAKLYAWLEAGGTHSQKEVG